MKQLNAGVMNESNEIPINGRLMQPIVRYSALIILSYH